MNKHSEDFATLKQALALKKHERPASDYFDRLSASIRSELSIHANDSSEDLSLMEFDEENLRQSVSQWFESEAHLETQNPGTSKSIVQSAAEQPAWLNFFKSVLYGFDLKPALAGVYAVATFGLVIFGFMIGSNPDSNPAMPTSNVASSLPEPLRQWFGNGETIATKALKESEPEDSSQWPRFWPASNASKTSSFMDGFLTSASSGNSSSRDFEENLWNASPGFLANPTHSETGIGLWRDPSWAIPANAFLASTNHNELPPAFFDTPPLKTYPVRFQD